MLKRLLFRAAIKQLAEIAEPNGVDRIDLDTALAINAYCLQHPLIGERPFASAADGDNVLSDPFDIGGWARVFGYQRMFWLNFPSVQNGIPVIIRIRWIIGRDSPMEVVINGQ